MSNMRSYPPITMGVASGAERGAVAIVQNGLLVHAEIVEFDDDDKCGALADVVACLGGADRIYTHADAPDGLFEVIDGLVMKPVGTKPNWTPVRLASLAPEATMAWMLAR